MKKYKKNTWTFLFSSIATSCLGVFLIIPIVNNYILNEVIKQETGINTRYYYRPFGK